MLECDLPSSQGMSAADSVSVVTPSKGGIGDHRNHSTRTWTTPSSIRTGKVATGS